MTAQQFRAWRDRMKLSLSDAATALGVDRRQIARWQAGTTEIWHPVELACRYLEMQRRAKRK